MRATLPLSCAIFAFAWQSQFCLAQDVGAAKTSEQPRQALSSDKVGSDKAAGRVGSLSPDEARRAARGRARAAAADKAAQVPTHVDGRGGRDLTQAALQSASASGDAVLAHRSVAIADEHRPMSRNPKLARNPVVRSARAEAADHRRLRRLAGDPGRVPRIGDVVPAGVPLAPLPPDARPGPVDRVAATMDMPRGPLFYRPYQPAFPPYPGYPVPSAYPVYPYQTRVLLIR